MNAKMILLIYALLISICTAEEAHEYLRVQEKNVSYFSVLPEVKIPVLHSGSETSDKLDVKKIRQAVFEIVVFTKDSHEIINIASSATAFAVQVGDAVFLAGSYHALGNIVKPNLQFAVLVKGIDGLWFHVEKFIGVSEKTDFLLMKPSKTLQASFALASDAPQPLDTLYSCGLLGGYRNVFRKGEMMMKEESFMLTSIPATQGSSGSPVFNEKGLLVGMITEVIPLLRESGRYTGDHFAEYVMTKCRPF